MSGYEREPDYGGVLTKRSLIIACIAAAVVNIGWMSLWVWS